MRGTIDVIAIISNEPWGDIWYLKQHYAHELSQKGYSVYFIDPVVRWRPRDLFSIKVTSRQVEPNLTVVSYQNNFPVRVFPKLFRTLNDWLNSRKLKRVFRAKRMLWWQFDHIRFVTIGRLPVARRIYHVEDPHMNATNNHSIAKAANLIVCTSPKYLPFYSSYQAPKLYVPHCISKEEFALNENRVQAIKKQYPNCMVLIGSINEYVDFELLHKLVVNTDAPILLIGKETTLNEKSKRLWQALQHNVMYLGPVHAKQLKHYIAAATICLIAYRFDMKKAVGTGSPLKALHYLAQHKPVVTSIDSEIETLEGRAIYRAEDREDFIRLVQAGLAGRLEVDREAVDQYLSEHTYGSAIRKILEAL